MSKSKILIGFTLAVLMNSMTFAGDYFSESLTKENASAHAIYTPANAQCRYVAFTNSGHILSDIVVKNCDIVTYVNNKEIELKRLAKLI